MMKGKFVRSPYATMNTPTYHGFHKKNVSDSDAEIQCEASALHVSAM